MVINNENPLGFNFNPYITNVVTVKPESIETDIKKGIKIFSLIIYMKIFTGKNIKRL